MESLNRPINGSYESEVIERLPEPPVMIDLTRELREEAPMHEPSVKKQTKQQILQEYPIGIRFLSKGCVVEVGCKTIAFSTVPEAMEAVTTYVADPETVGEYWRGQFNM